MKGKLRCFWIHFAVAAPIFLGACASPPVGSSTDTEKMSAVIRHVEAALNDYQASAEKSKDLLQLQSADFDFKVTTAAGGGGSVELLIFKLGASSEFTAVSQVAYHYEPKPIPKGPDNPGIMASDGQLLAAQVREVVEAAAQTVRDAHKLGNIPFSNLTVVVQFGVKSDGSIQVSPTIGTATVGLKGSVSANDVQTVKLVFKPKTS